MIKLVGTVGVGASVARNVRAAENNKRTVKEARDAAKRTVERASSRDAFATWQGASVGQHTTFHARNTAAGPKYVQAAYVFTVRNRGEDVGYVTTGARPDWSAVMEYSTAEPPQRGVGPAQSKARKHGVKPTGRLLYHGGVKYGVELANSRAMNVRNGRTTPVRGLNPAEVATESNEGGVSVSSTDYERLSEVPAWSTPEKKAEDGDVDPWDYWDGCAPVAGSMIVAYHEDVEKDKKEEYIDDLHVDMETSTGGTTLPTTIDDGFDVFDTGDNSYTGRNIYIWQHPDFVKQEIGAERPFLLNMLNGDSADDRNTEYDDHTVAVVGYDEGGDELILHDTWGTETHHLDYGSWQNASYTKVTVN